MPRVLRRAVLMSFAAAISVASVVDVTANPGARASSTSSLQGPRTTALDAAEEQGPAVQALVRRFNPAMALPIREVWPVELRYAWHDGADLVARVEDSDDETVVVPSGALGRSDWSRLPHATPDGRAIRYYIDAPGDDRPRTAGGLSSWRLRFREIAQPQGEATVPTASPYPPTQYAHVYWWNRDQGLLAVQYWFYYPFNEWVNNHEGDWEHIQVILKGPPSLTASADATGFRPVSYQYFFHSFQTEPVDVVRFGGADPREDHPLVYVGGTGAILGYGGGFSGGSYPLPARYPGAAFDAPVLNPADDTSTPARFIAAADFKIIVLPEPARLDAARAPELSWLRLPFHVGQRRMHRNPPLLGRFGGDRPPLQPAARGEWLSPSRLPAWAQQVERGLAAPEAHPWPSSWACIAPAQRGCGAVLSLATRH
jgi:hypothetical protein